MYKGGRAIGRIYLETLKEPDNYFFTVLLSFRLPRTFFINSFQSSTFFNRCCSVWFIPHSCIGYSGTCPESMLPCNPFLMIHILTGLKGNWKFYPFESASQTIRSRDSATRLCKTHYLFQYGFAKGIKQASVEGQKIEATCGAGNLQRRPSSLFVANITTIKNGEKVKAFLS